MTSEIIVAFITGVLGPISVILIKKYLDSKKEKPDMVRETLRESEQVLTKLDKIKDEMHCDRVWICQFHNGGHFYPTGKSMTKFSMIYEVVGLGANSIQSQFQNIPVNLFSRSINHLLENDTIEIRDYKDETVATYGLKYVAEDTGCKSGYLFAIKTIEGKYIATLGLDYTKKVTELSIEDVHHVSNYAASLGGVLMGQIEKH